MLSAGTYTGSSTTNGGDASMYSYFVRTALDICRRQLRMVPLGFQQPLSEGFGKQITFIKYAQLAAATATLTEGTPPTAVALSAANVTAAISQYGKVIEISDLLGMTAADRVEQAVKEEISANAALTLDQLTMVAVNAACSANRVYANGAALSALSAGVTLRTFLAGVTKLKAANVLPHSGQDYVAVIHPNSSFDIMADTAAGGWNDVHKYTDAAPLLNGEIGRAYGIRFVESTAVITAAEGKSSAVIYHNILLGKQPFAVTTLGSGGGKGFQIFVKGFGSAGSADPLDQIMSVGWKANFAVKYLGNVSAPVSDPHRAVCVVGGTAA